MPSLNDIRLSDILGAIVFLLVMWGTSALFLLLEKAPL